MIDKPHIQYHNDVFTDWFKVGSDRYFCRPRGYYFFDETKTWCFGPFDTVEECDEGYERWLGMPSEFWPAKKPPKSEL